MTDSASPSKRLAELGLTLPSVPAPLAAYVPAVSHGGLVWSSGQLPMVGGQLVRGGLVQTASGGAGTVGIPEASELARICALNALAAVAAAAGPRGIDGIVRIVKVVGYVACAPGFTGQPAVVDGASGLLAEVFGEAGRSARSAVGVAALPLGSPVEIELIAALADEET